LPTITADFSDTGMARADNTGHRVASAAAGDCCRSAVARAGILFGGQSETVRHANATLGDPTGNASGGVRLRQRRPPVTVPIWRRAGRATSSTCIEAYAGRRARTRRSPSAQDLAQVLSSARQAPARQRAAGVSARPCAAATGLYARGSWTAFVRTPRGIAWASTRYCARPHERPTRTQPQKSGSAT